MDLNLWSTLRLKIHRDGSISVAVPGGASPAAMRNNQNRISLANYENMPTDNTLTVPDTDDDPSSEFEYGMHLDAVVPDRDYH
jgi:hypothetical protein